MKKILTLLILGCALVSNAQQLPLYSQYYFNQFIHNPALTGAQDANQLHLIGRKQYSGVSSGIGTNAITLQLRPEASKAGFGLYFMNDKTNLVRRNAVYGNYSYHAMINETAILSLGLAAGIHDNRYDFDKFKLSDPNDPRVALLQNQGNFTADANLGANIKSNNFNFGVAVLQLANSNQKFSDDYNNDLVYNLERTFIVTTGYKFSAKENYTFEPYILYRKTKNAKGQVDLNFMFDWADKAYLGFGYRDAFSVSGMAGVHLGKTLTVGYAYDQSIHKEQKTLGGTHEIMIGIDFGRKSRSKSGEILASDTDTSSLSNGYELRLSMLEEEIDILKEEGVEVSGVDNHRVDTIVIIKENVVKESNNRPSQPKSTWNEPERNKPTKPVVNREPFTPPVPPNDVKSPTATYGNFYVICGTFGDPTYSRAYVNKLKRRGHRTATSRYANSKHYVHLGRFSTKEEAVRFIGNNKDGTLKLWVKEM